MRGAAVTAWPPGWIDVEVKTGLGRRDRQRGRHQAPGRAPHIPAETHGIMVDIMQRDRPSPETAIGQQANRGAPIVASNRAQNSSAIAPRRSSVIAICPPLFPIINSRRGLEAPWPPIPPGNRQADSSRQRDGSLRSGRRALRPGRQCRQNSVPRAPSAFAGRPFLQRRKTGISKSSPSDGKSTALISANSWPPE